MTQVVLQDLTRRFNGLTAVNRLSLDIQSGELIALLGPSGCGKTTTLRMIAGLLLPTDGDIVFNGKSMLTVPAEKRGAVMVFQKHLLFPTMNVAQNIGFGLKMQRMPQHEIDKRVAKMLELVQLPGLQNRAPHQLSGGQQQRIALARALIVRPRVLLLDEPLANLDANLRLDMRELIRSIQRELGTTTIFVTHDQEEAVMLADRIALLFDGTLQQFDTPRAFYEQPNSAAVARFFRNNNLLPGKRCGNRVETLLGTLTIDPNKVTQPDGEAHVTVRPEDVRLAPGPTAENVIHVRLLSAVYMGTYTELQLDLLGRKWLAHGPSHLNLQAGDMIPIQLPPEKIWLLPPA